MKAYLINGKVIINATSKKKATEKAMERVSQVESIEVYKPYKPTNEWWERTR